MINVNFQEGLSIFKKYQNIRIAHWNQIAHGSKKWRWFNGYYYKRLKQVLQFVIPPGQRIIEIGCGQGDLLAALEPSYGVGVDFSPEMIASARMHHPDLHFVEADAHELKLNENFDFVILSDLVNDLWDVQTVLQNISSFINPQCRVIITSYNRFWELPLTAVRKLGLAKPSLFQNWLTVEDIAGLLSLANCEVVRHWDEIIWPIRLPVIDSFLNRFVAKVWPFYWFDMTHIIVAKPCSRQDDLPRAPKVSVIVPARNEEGNIKKIFAEVPDMGSSTELIFVEGGSKDKTYNIIEKTIMDNPHRQSKLLRQNGRGKADAVRLGFQHASGDILMIYDADMTVPPEDLSRFYDVLTCGKGEFVNGVRLVYPMEKEAMRTLNFLGNKFFSLAFSWLLGQSIKDTLCGTKALWKRDYDRITANRSYFGEFDPFGDFDLLFGAAKLNLKIVEIPVRYRERTYGATNISRWSHGWLLLRMVVFALRRIKFV